MSYTLAILRGTIVNRTYGVHKGLYTYVFLLDNIWSYLLWSPRNSVRYKETHALFGVRPRFGDKVLRIRVPRPQHGTAALVF